MIRKLGQIWRSFPSNAFARELSIRSLLCRKNPHKLPSGSEVPELSVAHTSSSNEFPSSAVSHNATMLLSQLLSPVSAVEISFKNPEDRTSPCSLHLDLALITRSHSSDPAFLASIFRLLTGAFRLVSELSEGPPETHSEAAILLSSSSRSNPPERQAPTKQCEQKGTLGCTEGPETMQSVREKQEEQRSARECRATRKLAEWTRESQRQQREAASEGQRREAGRRQSSQAGSSMAF